METLQRRLADAVAPSVPFVALHADAVRGVAEILCDLQVLRCDIEEACARGLARAFLPHGLGHHLGLQVHDVGGRQVSPAGDQREPPASHPHLRTTRALAPGHVVTIEPGLYFIPMLLDAVRAGSDAQAVDWPLVEALAPCGGIRIEDDVLVTDTGCENLTRPAWEAALER
jgi:Xaa-Pro dipeptidase